MLSSSNEKKCDERETEMHKYDKQSKIVWPYNTCKNKQNEVSILMISWLRVYSFLINPFKCRNFLPYIQILLDLAHNLK